VSRLPSSRGSSAASSSPRSAPAGRRPGVLVQSPKSDIYVTLLAIALGSVVLGCILMLIMFGRYNFSTKVSALPAASQHTALV
jgi:hypothetical protein